MLKPEGFPYNQQWMTADELEARLFDKGEALSVAKVLDAYAMAKSVHEFQKRNDGTPYFYHSTRVAKILMDELHVFDADVISAALLHDVLEDSDAITRGVLEYNFGSYVAYMVEVLTKDLSRAKMAPDEVDIQHVAALSAASDDCVIIRLTARLDNFRCLGFSLKRNPHIYIQNTFSRYLPIAEKSSNACLEYLREEIRSVANKFLG
ncbi:MAG: bifunctional (p)ppGpp synthetase/guanosine-3',5'-bis(diphosphate) 3'-pyrophosphohydrolase [Ignavibacteria bacterium]|nr:bifunctional (p)ppGpp synthetase/guanosine-3',5'-bis(diphosphate) 3'-pyrophosphohydrolase [Ignavibacteria bacterium]